MIKNIAKIAAITLTASAFQPALAATDSRIESINDRPGSAMTKCVSSIQGYHPKKARLFLSNRATVTETESGEVITVDGWVWENGARNRVSHQCSPLKGKQVALRVIYEGNEELAAK